jgi:hypothetical protein
MILSLPLTCGLVGVVDKSDPPPLARLPKSAKISRLLPELRTFTLDYYTQHFYW